MLILFLILGSIVSQSRQDENVISVTPSDSTPTSTSNAVTNPSEPSQATQSSPNKRKLGNVYSKVWLDYEQTIENGSKMAICHHCKKMIYELEPWR